MFRITHTAISVPMYSLSTLIQNMPILAPPHMLGFLCPFASYAGTRLSDDDVRRAVSKMRESISDDVRMSTNESHLVLHGKDFLVNLSVSPQMPILSVNQDYVPGRRRFSLHGRQTSDSHAIVAFRNGLFATPRMAFDIHLRETWKITASTVDIARRMNHTPQHDVNFISMYIVEDTRF